MARRRQTVQPLQDLIQAQPQAGPVGGADVTVARPDLPIYDFAPISKTISSYLAETERKDAEKKIQAGERWALENPALVAHVEENLAEIKDAKERALKAKDAFAFLQRNGQIVAPADPFWQVGYHRAAGRQLADQYRDRLNARMAEVSTVRDPATGDVKGTPDLDAIMSEEWEKVSQSPAVQSLYGGQEALATKSNADAEFRKVAAEKRAAAQEKDYQDMLSREIGGRFDQILGANAVVTTETLQPITDFLTEEVRGHNVMNPRELTMDAIELSIQRLSAVDADEAVRAVHAAQDLVVGGVRLGDDRGPVGLHLQTLTQRVREQARNADLEELRGTDAKRKLAVQHAEGEYVPILQRAKEDGLSVQAAADKLAAEYLGGDDPMAPFVVEAMREYARNVDTARTSDAGVLDQFNTYLADGRLDAAEALARSAMATHSLTGKDYGTALATLEQRRSVSQYVEENGIYNAVRQRYGDARPKGFAPEIQAKIDADVLDRQRRLEREFSAYVKTTEGEPNREDLHRAWLAEREGADLADIRKFETATRTKGDAAVTEIRQKLSRYQDAGDVIERALQEGAITAADAQTYREARDQAVANRESFFTTPAYKESQQLLDAEFDRLDGGEAPTPEGLAARRAAHDEMRDRFSVALDAMLADPASTPATFEARARSEARRVEREVHQELFPSPEAKATEVGLQAGKGAEESIDQARALTADLTRAQSWASLIATPAARESMTGAMFAQVPELAKPVGREGGTWAETKNSFYDYAAAWMSGRDPILGAPVRRADVEEYAHAILRSQPSPAATSSVLSVIGVSPQEVLAGHATLQPVAKAEVQAHADRLQRMSGLGMDSAGLRAQLSALEAMTRPVEVPLEGLALNPYTTPFFRTEAAMEAFRQDPAYADFLRKLQIDPDDDALVNEWERHQLNNIQRTNP